MTSTSPLQQSWTNTMMNAYGTPALGLVRGKGCIVEDENGEEYLDLLSGIAVNCLGLSIPPLSRRSPISCILSDTPQTFLCTHPRRNWQSA